MRRPETRFAKSGDAHIAYQVVGNGPLDLVYVPGWVSNVGAELGGAVVRAVPHAARRRSLG